MKVYDCFPFLNELDILDIRLHEMDPWVDYFVLVESAETFSGKPKPLWFEENKDRFEPFLPKIIHLIAPVIDRSKTVWERQDSQRSCAMGALTNCADDDLILIGDVDEIFGIDFVEIQGDIKGQVSFIHQNYLYYMNLRRPGAWPGLVMVPYCNILSEYGGSFWEVRRLRRKGKKINGGWHFANMGGKDAYLLKLRASCHFNTPSYKKMMTDPDFLYDVMEGKREIKGRKLCIVPIDDSYPMWFRENIEKFKHLLTKEV